MLFSETGFWITGCAPGANAFEVCGPTMKGIRVTNTIIPVTKRTLGMIDFEIPADLLGSEPFCLAWNLSPNLKFSIRPPIRSCPLIFEVRGAKTRNSLRVYESVPNEFQ